MKKDEAKFGRFKDAPWFQNTEAISVMVGGAGGIGSWLTVLLCRIGFMTYVFDFDNIEQHNLGGQLFKSSQVGMPKVLALKEVVKEFCNETLIANNVRITNHSMSNQFVFTAFDNMKARKDMFISWNENFGNDPTALFMDGRLTAEQVQIFCIRGGDTYSKELYLKEHLFDDSEVDDAPCTFRQTSHSAAMISSHMVGFFTNHLANINVEDEIYKVPFKWEYFIPNSYMEAVISTSEYGTIQNL